MGGPYATCENVLDSRKEARCCNIKCFSNKKWQKRGTVGEVGIGGALWGREKDPLPHRVGGGEKNLEKVFSPGLVTHCRAGKR